jgi:heptosyltransferase-3
MLRSSSVASVAPCESVPSASPASFVHSPVKRLIVYRSGAVGDAIVAIPAIRALRAAYPRAVMALVAARAAAAVSSEEVFGELGLFDEVITYDAVSLANIGSLRALRRQVRRFGADMVVHLGSEQNSWLRVQRDRAFFTLSGVPRFVGRAAACVTWYGRLRTGDAAYVPEVDRLLQLAVSAGAAPDAPVVFDLPIGDGHRRRVDAWLAAAGLDGSRPLAAVCPGSKVPAKRWPAERYADVCRELIVQSGLAVVVVGGREERELGHGLAARWPAGTWANAAGSLSILESAELLRRCQFYVGNDTGAMHLAAAVGTRCVAIFSARCPGDSWHPYGTDHVVLRRRPPCRHCFLDECTTHRSRCLTEIPADEVTAACARVISTS